MNKPNNKTLALDLISAFARFFMAGVWLVAGWTKAGEYMAVTQSIKGYEILPSEWAGYVAYLMAPLEIAGGLLLLFGLFLRKSSAVSLVVLLLFMIGIAQAWVRGLAIDCGCFSVSPNEDGQAMNYFLTLLRDAFFVALTAWTIWRPFKKWAIYP